MLEGESLLNDATALVALQHRDRGRHRRRSHRARSALDFLVAAVGGRWRGVAGLRRRRQGAQARHRPGHGHLGLDRDPLHRLRRWPRRSTPRASWPSCRRAAPGAPGAGAADRLLPDRRAAELAHRSRSCWRTPSSCSSACRPAGSSTRSRTASLSLGHDRRAPASAAARGRHRAAAVWVFAGTLRLLEPAGSGATTRRRGVHDARRAGPGCAAW